MSRELKTRKSLRLPNYDYSKAGRYFVTICTQNKECILSCIVSTDIDSAALRVQLTPYGQIVERQIQDINIHYDDVQITQYVIMPNHVHMLVEILQPQQNGPSRTPAPTLQRLPVLLSTLKRLTHKTCGFTFWQRGYFEHIIRNDDEMGRISQYIAENPYRWSEDRYYNEPGILP